jgi:hypothetical protein
MNGILWLGHCGEAFPEMLDEDRNRLASNPGLRYMSRRFVVEDDMTAPPRKMATTGLGLGLVHFRDHTRWVHVLDPRDVLRSRSQPRWRAGRWRVRD